MDSLELTKFDMKKIKPTHVCAFVAKRNSGKCLAEGTEVRMYNGDIKKIEEIKEGELVMGDDFAPRTVMSTTSGTDELIRIIHENGLEYTVNTNHIISLKNNGSHNLFEIGDFCVVRWFNTIDIKLESKYFIFNEADKEDVCKKARDFYEKVNKDLCVDINVIDYLNLTNYKRSLLFGYHQDSSLNKINLFRAGVGKYYGFELDGNHRFVLGNSIVTHNSFLIRDLMYHHQNIPAGMVVSKTDKLTHYYEQFIPPVLIHEEYSPGLLDKLFDRQKKALQESWPNPHAFLIFDDTISDANVWKRDTRIKEIFFNGRHYKILFLLTMQDPKAITPGLRSNIDFSFILRTPNQAIRRALYENYCGMFPTYEIFEKVLDSCTEDYGCLVIDNTSKSNKLEDQVFYYKASDHSEFKMCSSSYWLKKRPAEIKNDSSSKQTVLKNNKKFTITKKTT
jgi:hypothetical protein